MDATATSTATPTVGTPSGHDVVDVLRALARDQQSGVLKVGSTAPTWVVLAHGQVVVAGTTNGSGIAQTFHAAGVIDDETLRRSGARGGSHDLTVLTELVSTHSADALAPVVHTQAVHAIFQMLLPPQEPAAFLPGAPVALARHFSFPVESLLSEAQARVRQWAEIAESIPSTQAVFRLRRRLAAELDTVVTSRDQWSVLAVLDGRRSVAQVIGAAGRSPYDVCAVLHQLIQAGLIERTS
jgi:hypothetical protein